MNPPDLLYELWRKPFLLEYEPIEPIDPTMWTIHNDTIFSLEFPPYIAPSRCSTQRPQNAPPAVPLWQRASWFWVYRRDAETRSLANGFTQERWDAWSTKYGGVNKTYIYIYVYTLYINIYIYCDDYTVYIDTHTYIWEWWLINKSPQDPRGPSSLLPRGSWTAATEHVNHRTKWTMFHGYSSTPLLHKNCAESKCAAVR